MSLRGPLKSVKILLEETPITAENAPGLAERIQELSTRIEQQPQFSAVRPATIALRNLIVSLRRGPGRPGTSSELAEERDAAIEALGELLADETFGIEGDDLRVQVDKALKKNGVHACSACKNADLAIDPVYLFVKPFPSDPALSPSQLPCAIVACKRCGMMWMHDLALLGVM